MPFIAFEGIEGSGKSTQVRRLAAQLGPGVVLTQEPGGTEIGQAIRALLLDRRNAGLAPEAELLLFFADRAQNVAQVIRPALGESRVVISDRYADSSRAYQGYGRGLALGLLDAALELATGGLRPDLTLFLDVPVELGLSRVRARGGADRMESEAVAFHRRVRAGYLELAALDPERWVTVDGTLDEDAIAVRVWAAVHERLGLGAR
jgi:dTMP kinase